MKLIRQFEEGDVVASTIYNHVCVRVAGDGGKWKSSNGDFSNQYYYDKEVNSWLDQETWVYMGNRKRPS